MTPFIRTHYPPEAYDPDAIQRRFAHVPGMNAEQAAKIAARNRAGELYVNDRYEVLKVSQPPAQGEGPLLIHLSIKRRDKAPIRDWRDLQAIKNALTDPEFEGVELFPAESRLTDSANQYHLFVVADRGYRFPFGFNARLVLDAEVAASTGGRQRPLPRDTES